jgi:hypothetical protein
MTLEDNIQDLISGFYAQRYAEPDYQCGGGGWEEDHATIAGAMNALVAIGDPAVPFLERNGSYRAIQCLNSIQTTTTTDALRRLATSGNQAARFCLGDPIDAVAAHECLTNLWNYADPPLRARIDAFFTNSRSGG